jgi:hypothetical protein
MESIWHVVIGLETYEFMTFQILTLRYTQRMMKFNAFRHMKMKLYVLIIHLFTFQTLIKLMPILELEPKIKKKLLVNRDIG